MTSEILTRDCAPGDLLYKSHEFCRGVFFEIKLLSFDTMPENEVEFKQSYCEARLELRICVPIDADGSVSSELISTNTPVVAAERLDSNWGFHDTARNCRNRTRIGRGINIQNVFDNLLDAGNTACSCINDIVKRKEEVKRQLEEKRKEVLSTFKVQYKLLNTESEQKG